MDRVEKSIDIRAPPEKVWEMLSFDRQVEWDEEIQKNLKSLEFTSEVRNPEDKYKLGTIAQAKIKGAGGGEFDFEITESLENEKMTFHVKKSETNQALVIVTFILKAIEEETRLTVLYDYEMPWGIFGKFINKLFGRRMEEKHQEKCLQNLKKILEK